MPLLNIHVVKGRNESQTSILLQTIHDSMVKAFEVPVRDRYQILHEHDSSRFIMEDTGLGFVRTDKRVLIHMTTRPRSQQMKEHFYNLLVGNLGQYCDISPEDIMISCIENNDADWSFGFGRAQFLVGDL